MNSAHTTRPQRPRTPRTVWALAALLAAGSWAAPSPAVAAETGSGDGGQTVTVSQASGLSPEGTQVTITGAGFDESKGIYLAQCVDNGPGARPTPCIGGVDMSGESASSLWISSNPPSYGEGLAVPYGAGGTFEATLTLRSSDGTTDCLDPVVAPNGCVLATFADHTRIDDRSADVRVPLSFGGQDEGSEAGEPSAEAAATAEAGSTAEAEATAVPGASEVPSAEQTVVSAAPEDAEEPAAGAGALWLYLVLGFAAFGGAVAVIASKARAVRRAERDQRSAPGGRGTPGQHEDGEAPGTDDHDA